MTTTNFPNGVSNTAQQNALGALKILDPTVNHTYFNDFDLFNAADWIITKTQVGATTAITNSSGGVLLVTNTAANNDLVALQLANETFKFDSGKKFAFKAKLLVSDANLSAFVIGLQITDTTPLSVTNGVYFQKASASTNLSFNTTASSTTTTASNVLSITSAAYFTLAFYYDGKSSLNYYASNDASLVDGSLNPTFVGTLPITNLPSSSQTLTISYALANGEAVAKTMSVDYIFVSKER